MSVFRLWRVFMADEKGTTALEYALILALVFMVFIGALTLFADRTTAKFNFVSTAVASVS